ncbi:MAG: RDD family protein, partial [Betaproteobacteria bacterium]|nr:RDD family protein [Betaproteobacteria bacterium]
VYRFLFALGGLVLCGAGFAWALFDRDRQFLHDRLAGTRIVMSDK